MTVVKTDNNARKTCSADAVLHLDHFKAFIFDLDGVITQTAKIHAVAWKKMFDDYLAKHTPHGKAYTPFDIESDYLRYVDGKTRYDGVRSFSSHVMLRCLTAILATRPAKRRYVASAT